MADALVSSWLIGAVGGNNPPTLAVLLLGFGVMLMVFLLMRHQWRRSARGSNSNSTPSERIEEIRARADSGGALQQSMAEATAHAQRLSAQLDNRSERLEQLLEEAERAIQRLERAKGASRVDEEQAEETDVDPATRQIYALADEGLEPMEIAQRLDQHLGKVQLVLALRRA